MTPCFLDSWTAGLLGKKGAALTRSDLDAYRDKTLQLLLLYCQQHSAFYRHKWAGIDIAAIRSVDDLKRLPCTTEAELRRFGPEFLCVSQDEVARIVTLHSSGSTGAAKRLFFTEEDLERTRDFFHHGMGHFTRSGDKVAIMLPGERPDSTGALLAEALSRLPAQSRVFGLVENLVEHALELGGWQPRVLVGFPVQVLALVRMAQHLGKPLQALSAALLCSDYIPHSVCVALRDEAHCSVFSHYGSVESGLGAAVDCSFHSGLHLRETDLLVEILDKELRVQRPGNWGEIVLTTPTRRGMPLVRYCSGDMGRLLTGQCPCGSVLARLDQVKGRRMGQLSLANEAQLNLPILDEALFSLPGLLDVQATFMQEASGKEVLQVQLASLPDSEKTNMAKTRTILNGMEELSGVTVHLQGGFTGLFCQGKRQLIVN